MHVFLHVYLFGERNEKDTPLNVAAGVTATIKNKDETKRLSIHKDGFLRGIKPNNFAKCEHLEESDVLVQDIILGQAACCRNS